MNIALQKVMVTAEKLDALQKTVEEYVFSIHPTKGQAEKISRMQCLIDIMGDEMKRLFDELEDLERNVEVFSVYRGDNPE